MSKVSQAIKSPKTLTTYQVQVKDDQIMIEI